MDWIHCDGGREAAGFKGETGDCVVRAIAITTKRSYKEVYDALHCKSKDYLAGHSNAVTKTMKKRGGTSPRDGCNREIYQPYLGLLGWVWVPIMKIGSGCVMHLKKDELPDGRIIARVSKHLVAIIDGVLHDTHDCSRDETRCVYGYFQNRR